MTRGLQNYAALRKAVRLTLLEGQRRIEALRLETYWKTGQLIRNYLGEDNERAGAAFAVLDRLSGDLDIERSIFYRVLQFYDAYPGRVAPGRHLTWTHYRNLLAVPEKTKRLAFEKRAAHDAWPVRRLRTEIEAYLKKNSGRKKVVLVEPPRLAPGTFPLRDLVTQDGARDLVVDLGFYTYKEIKEGEIDTDFASGMRVHWEKEKRRWVRAAQSDEPYYYEGAVEKVVDGDTLLIHVALGFGLKRRQYLRLRAVNTEPLHTSQGKKAQSFLREKLKPLLKILFKSNRTDIYDRFISDVWAGGLYLNQALLDAGLADAV